jgi:hypothetical protein
MAKKSTALANFEGFEFGSEGNPTEFIPTGHAELDYVIASGLLTNTEDSVKTGGIPTGKLMMIYGGEAGGKSSLAYAICGNAQRMGKIPIWIDVENSFSESLAKINGVDLAKIGRRSMFDKNDTDKVFDGEAGRIKRPPAGRTRGPRFGELASWGPPWREPVYGHADLRALAPRLSQSMDNDESQRH